jgi:CheY-like chemotaxis protein
LERGGVPTPVRTPFDTPPPVAPRTPSGPVNTQLHTPAPAQPQQQQQPAPQPAPAPPPPVAKIPTRPAIEVHNLKPIGKALVTDDDAVTRELLGGILKQNGVPFDEAHNGADAIKLLKQNQYGLLFLDLLMPRIDGWGVLDFLRSKSRASQMKIYVLTGYREQRLSTADQEIVAGIIYKPVHADEIDRILQRTAKALAS